MTCYLAGLWSFWIKQNPNLSFWLFLEPLIYASIKALRFKPWVKPNIKTRLNHFAAVLLINIPIMYQKSFR